MSTFYKLLLDSIEFYSQFGWTKKKTYNYLKDNFLRYENVKYIQNKKHGVIVHYKWLNKQIKKRVQDIYKKRIK